MRDVSVEGKLPGRGLAALARGAGMTRVGAIVTKHEDQHVLGGLCFQLIRENGHLTLGTWRVAAIRWISNRRQCGVRTIFERVS